MHLDAEQVPDAMREEHAGHAVFRRLLGRASGDDARLHQRAGNQAMREQVNLAVIESRSNGGAQLELQLLHRSHQFEEGRVGACRIRNVRARDVARIAAELRARVDQERGARHVAPAAQRRVVQDGGSLAKRDDVAVGQLLFPQSDGRAVRLVDFEFRGPRAVGLFRRDMTDRPEP